MSESITTSNLSKNFGKLRAVREVSLHVNEGEIYGFLGLNGAGKTTTIRMLLGMIRPTSGEARLFQMSASPKNRDLWNRVGYLVEIPYSYPDLTVRENLEIIRRLRSITDPQCVSSIIERLGLEEYADIPARHLSLGNGQRLGLAKALIHEPEMLILDEPANGLDPEGIVEIRRMLKELAAENGVTIFISSHILGEISKFANRIGIIHRGRLLREVDTDKLEGQLRRRLLVSTRDNPKANSLMKKRGLAASVLGDGMLSLEDQKAIANPENVASLLVNGGCPPVMLRVEEEDLESYFLRVIGSTSNRGESSR
ncbi:MAG TPA: ABC transporter ATP-binding protein [Candidatus Kryptonia bacterium]